MAVPSSGELKLWDDLWNQELGGSKGENSLHSASIYAGFTTPDALSDFYGWSDVEVPTVTSNGASSVGSTSMTANGTVNTTGNENPDRGFYFGTSTNRTSNTKYSVGTGGTGAFSRSMTGLSSLTTYYYWAYASNSAGEAVGSRITQATTDAPFSFSYASHGAQATGPNRNRTYAINPYSGTYNHTHTNTSNSPGQRANSATNATNYLQGTQAQSTNFRTAQHLWSNLGTGFQSPYSGGYGGATTNNHGVPFSSTFMNWRATFPVYAQHSYNLHATTRFSDLKLKTNITYL